MTNTELSAIRARCECTLVCSAKDIPALLAHIDEQRVTLAKVEADKAELVEALEKLARLGNGDKYGNSDGNCIAQAALTRVKEVSCQKN